MANIIKVARLPFLIAGLVLFLLGALIGEVVGGRLVLGPLLLGYLVVAAARLCVHFSNDYFDADTDTSDSSTLISGGGGVLLHHPELREPVRRIALALIGLSLAAGIGLVVLYRFPSWTLGLVALGNLVGWFYSAPPLRLCGRGWGEACYVFAAGMIEPGLGYLTARRTLDTAGAFFLLPLLIYALVSILNAEIPDFEADHAAGKGTLVERRGRGFGFVLSGLLLAAATIYFFLLRISFPAAPVDENVLALFSMVPLAPGLVALFLRPRERSTATHLATVTVICLVVMGVLINTYLFALARHL